jgi:DnaJ-class molecular chaperone
MATRVCPECKGHGVLPAGKFSPRHERECDVCEGAGEVDRDEDEQ